MKHLNDHNILIDCQHGFRAKRSTEMQLILNLHDMAKAIHSSSIHALVLDFAKDSDKVPHKRLLRKLQHYGIQGLLPNWLESFLTQRFQSLFVKAKHQGRANLGLNFNPGFFFFYSKEFSREIFSILFKIIQSSYCKQKELNWICFFTFEIRIQSSH